MLMSIAKYISNENQYLFQNRLRYRKMMVLHDHLVYQEFLIHQGHRIPVGAFLSFHLKLKLQATHARILHQDLESLLADMDPKGKTMDHPSHQENRNQDPELIQMLIGAEVILTQSKFLAITIRGTVIIIHVTWTMQYIMPMFSNQNGPPVPSRQPTRNRKSESDNPPPRPYRLPSTNSNDPQSPLVTPGTASTCLTDDQNSFNVMNHSHYDSY